MENRENRRNPLRALSYTYRFDSAGQVVSVELHQARDVLRPATKFVTFFVRDDDLEAMYTFTDFKVPAGGMHLYSGAWVDHALKRQHIISGEAGESGFICDYGITEICYTLAINGKSYCDRYEYSRVSDLRTVTTLDFECLEPSGM